MSCAIDGTPEVSAVEKTLLSGSEEAVMDSLVEAFRAQLNALFRQIKQEGTTPRALEEGIWQRQLEMGRAQIAVGFAGLALRATDRDLEKRGLSKDQVRLRADQDYWATVKSTFGDVSFPLGAYRDTSSGVATVTRTPARGSVFRLQQHCRSTELCLEWQTRLGSEHPFRRAQESIHYFTHGAVKIEDTTIAEHMKVVGQLVDRDWTYKTKEEIAKTLRERATRDTDTDQPIAYLSTDGHNLRRYVDDTWNAVWKQANGLRLWCVDRFSGNIIHLGGEYTWGDCQHVEEIVKWMQQSGRLPEDGDYGDGLVAKIAMPTDGALWIRERILPLFPGGLPILDPYHALEHVGDYGKLLYPDDQRRRQRWYGQAVSKLLGKKPSGSKKAKLRKGHRKRRPGAPPRRRSYNHLPRTHAGIALLSWLKEQEVPEKLKAAHAGLVQFIADNIFRLDYHRYRRHGYRIGSGAMESLHRSATQCRLKLPGFKCLPETGQAIFNLRMMALVGRWDEFWAQADITDQIVNAFANRAATVDVIEDAQVLDKAA
jgi:hypothetical protein